MRKILNQEYFRRKLLKDCEKAKKTGQFNTLKKYFKPEHRILFKKHGVVFKNCPDPLAVMRFELHKILADILMAAFTWGRYPMIKWNQDVRQKYLRYGFDYTYLLDMQKDEDYLKYLI